MLSGQKLRINDIVDEVEVEDEQPNQIRQKRNRNQLILQNRFQKKIQEMKSYLYLHLRKGGSSSQNDRMIPPLLREVPSLKLRMGRYLPQNSSKHISLHMKIELQPKIQFSLHK
jgi:hypothetical protein